MTTLLIWNRANPFESSQKSPTIYRVFFLHLSWFNSPTPGIFNLITSWSSNNKAALLPPNSVRTFQHRKDVGTSQNIPRICRKLTKPNQIHSKKNKILPFKMWPVFFATTESPLENKGGSVRFGFVLTPFKQPPATVDQDTIFNVFAATSEILRPARVEPVKLTSGFGWISFWSLAMDTWQFCWWPPFGMVKVKWPFLNGYCKWPPTKKRKRSRLESLGYIPQNGNLKERTKSTSSCAAIAWMKLQKGCHTVEGFFLKGRWQQNATKRKLSRNTPPLHNWGHHPWPCWKHLEAPLPPKPTESSKGFLWTFYDSSPSLAIKNSHTVDGWNPANHLGWLKP